MKALLLLGFGLGFDSFRASAALGAFPLSRREQARIVLAFGVCDGAAPLLGFLIGKSLTTTIHAWAAILGSLVVGTYGVVAVIKNLQSKPAASDRTLAPGIPLMLSLDNLVAGIGLGALGFPAILSAFVLGLTSSLMSVAGLMLGYALARRIPHTAEIVGGAALALFGIAGACGFM